MPGQKLTVWDGDSAGTSAKGWQECNKKPDCSVSLAAEPRAGKSGTGLEFHGEGADWMGFGWNWLGYWPSDGGTDISAAKVLTFHIKVESWGCVVRPARRRASSWPSPSLPKTWTTAIGTKW